MEGLYQRGLPRIVCYHYCLYWTTMHSTLFPFHPSVCTLNSLFTFWLRQIIKRVEVVEELKDQRRFLPSLRVFHLVLLTTSSFFKLLKSPPRQPSNSLHRKKTSPFKRPFEVELMEKGTTIIINLKEGFC